MIRLTFLTSNLCLPSLPSLPSFFTFGAGGSTSMSAIVMRGKNEGWGCGCSLKVRQSRRPGPKIRLRLAKLHYIIWIFHQNSDSSLIYFALVSGTMFKHKHLCDEYPPTRPGHFALVHKILMFFKFGVKLLVAPYPLRRGFRCQSRHN